MEDYQSVITIYGVNEGGTTYCLLIFYILCRLISSIDRRYRTI